ncbi:hypothetical protein [Neorhizobium sp. S3-V5DH]|uniref:hypothetical protein n=1 Tax=Neorhizobium sp. S3-V5DH TaxID=2485166 RepID=UPI0010539072|nr:hypothetical protein [Neorhizobium sp. S3-V5DH]TCV75918.1 hypothetical protein EDE09_101201 [Neorhizobium sp. S3-V5DH]
MSTNKPTIIRTGLERFLYDNEFEIRRYFKAIHPGNTFSVDGIASSQQRRVQILETVRSGLGRETLESSWNRATYGGSSAGCAFEQFRVRAWILGELSASLQSDFSNLYHLTLVDTGYRREAGKLRLFNLNRCILRAITTFHDLERTYPDMWAFGSLEISATPTADDGLAFEPHFHILIDGASEEAIRTAFRSRLTAKSGALRPIHLSRVSTRAEMLVVLSYLSKVEPNIRQQILGRNGRLISARPNPLKGDGYAEWLAWMAAHRADELLIGHGPADHLLNDFPMREMQPIVEELLRLSLREGR